MEMGEIPSKRARSAKLQKFMISELGSEMVVVVVVVAVAVAAAVVAVAVVYCIVDTCLGSIIVLLGNYKGQKSLGLAGRMESF
ncbi:hypothetical protein EYC80_003053 [Monilinia laxa]|uniref:Uncharacterized protein n=1 Tax=Monilinia laxa TaxID=61186 RepID=A0A5N6KCQ7_MONLA|nr:hypothetical protein EYC80_003053 [Monilinia laxa]